MAGSAGISSLGAVVPSELACEDEYWPLEVRLVGFLEPAECVSGAHGLYQAAIAQDLHHAFHVVSQDVQRHFGADVLQGLHLEVG